MKKENKPAGSLQKSLLFLVPLAVTTAAAAIGIASLKPVPTELPEKLAYADPTAAPTETEAPETTPDPGAETTEVPSAEPSETPEIATEPPATDEPSDAPETTPAQQSAAPTAGATATPKPTSTPAVTQGPNNPNAPTSAPTATPTAKPTTAPVTTAPTTPPTAAPTAAPTEAPGRYKDGSYTASARCETFNYDIEVTITIRGGDIKTVSVDYNSPENAPFMSMAINGTGGPGVPDQIVSNNGTEGVNVVSGATLSSNAIISASNSALARASKSVSGVIELTVLPDRRFHFFKAHSEESEER